MKLHNLFCLTAALLFWMPLKSHALICVLAGSGGNVSAITTVDTTIAVPNSKPKGTVLWRQPTQTRVMQCWVDLNGYPGEYVYFYVNPKKMDLGPDLEIGVTYQGKDYLASSLPGGRLKTDIYVNGCPNGVECGSAGTDLRTFTFSVFLVKKSPAGTAKDGPMAPISNYVAFQFDGEGAVRPGQSFNMTINGLNRLRYIPCESKIRVSPSIIDFRGISTNFPIPKPGQVIKQVPFTITDERTCGAVYGVNAYLTPVQGTLADNDTTLVPSDNTTVGINLLRADDLTTLAFKRELVLTQPTSTQTNVQNFLASLKWRTTMPKLGRFNAGAAIDLYYK
ncbi:fimbrial protein [Burkholderia anthina]|uniref:Fimbrial protein n=1 Tax=Burkholderia anthina TaxID=179879 RepID=A0AAW3PUA7_9BURK|nr:fimbrial protein [Burkholderia anthina]KVE07677.1 fimbrial protein [Burkholderia anthina]KWZ32321.1 fimbrial protein [Burkholderia anthina]